MSLACRRAESSERVMEPHPVFPRRPALLSGREDSFPEFRRSLHVFPDRLSGKARKGCRLLDGVANLQTHENTAILPTPVHGRRIIMREAKRPLNTTCGGNFR